MKFGDRLRELRKMRPNLSQKKLGEHLGLAESTISMYEQNRREPEYEILIKIADYFDVSIDYLLRGTDPKVQDKIFEDEAKRILNDPKTFIAARDGEITQEILDAALEIITEQLKEGGKKKSD
ncbi:helix-turn-helix transcriptional regulator [Bacillus licheniformis]|uniref:Probable transcriptional regulator (Phage-related) n=1 Tax=Bacillus licheniformis (strain ATCC 14580 / DSM 13 / JCM 2505 / CCUG 7422 / NBRC 12200 / NCIMB 9375 / NCTC 10341 / NRRL NRS-1264 / Gibson 46) TaxID=279010 RepID=Q65KS8_BACLD|nr:MULTISPECIES: helix-turn-helix transcriptional regulator [Bacillus]MBY8349897.1 XRE family transcriptional regulator [Bacillus sp. PCH94]AAU22983.1 probable transcriptional regulator (phage-related) [Bacillus licheniformis DSM 13 = ATCC 14580]AAU40336.1 phage putative repressor YqaE [Bacillus licheniformis DSM 13 = ATCC 14580]ARC62542.1 HTH-type transcriptional regulator Xre [Bacillus licheniformis]KJE30217.1 helix-turn-helix family protein [Bacillus licheniformis]